MNEYPRGRGSSDLIRMISTMAYQSPDYEIEIYFSKILFTLPPLGITLIQLCIVQPLTLTFVGKDNNLYLSIYLYIYLSMNISTYMYIYIYIYLSIFLSIYIFTYLSFYLLYIYLSIFLSIYIFTYLSFYLFVGGG